MNELPDVEEALRATRLRNLRIAVERAGGLTEFAKRMRVTSARIQALTRAGATVNIGAVFARKVEAEFGYPKNWLDHPNDEGSLVADVLEQIEKLMAENKTSQSVKLAQFLRDIQRASRDRKRKLSLENRSESLHNNSSEQNEESDENDSTPPDTELERRRKLRR